MASFFSKVGLSFSISNITFGILNWIFWVFAAKLTNVNNIGLASSAYSISMLFSTIALFSIEYPLLRSTSKNKSYFGSILVFEIIINIILIPFIVLAIREISDDYLLTLLSITIAFGSLFTTIANYSLLGSFSVRSVIIVQNVGVIMKIILLVLFLKFQMGSTGILLALASQFFITGFILSVLSIQKFGFHFRKESLKIIILEGISNFPSKISTILQTFGSISILSFFAIAHENIAAFTLSYGFVTFVSGISTSLALIIIPASTKENSDLSSISTRIGMAVTAPIITVLITSSTIVLGVYGNSYSKYYEVLSILSISLIPFILKINIITMLNNRRALKELALLGIIESVIFLITILVLIPQIGWIGGAWAITISSIGSGTLSLFWANKNMRKIFSFCVISIVLGLISNILIRQTLLSEYIILVTSFSITIISLFLFKLIRLSDVSFIITQLRKY